MLWQTSLPVERTSLPLQVETGQAALSQDVASQRRTRFLWTGLGLASLMLIGASACALHPLASHASVEPARPLSEVATFNPMPAIGHRGIRPPEALASLPHIRMVTYMVMEGCFHQQVCPFGSNINKKHAN
jgi:hypothetical protein